jgi:hypothetical protein
LKAIPHHYNNFTRPEVYQVAPLKTFDTLSSKGFNMRYMPAPLLLFFVLVNLAGQTPVGTWSDHLNYNVAQSVTAGSEEVFASNGSSILVYNSQLAELRKLSKVNGLTETGISAIGYSEDTKTLVVGYNSANIDLVANNVVYNIPDIQQKFITGEKRINKIRTRGKYAYLACSFGIVVIDILKKEVHDTWYPVAGTSGEVLDITFGNGKVFAAGKGVFSGDLSNPGLSYSGNWNPVSSLPDPAGKYNLILYLNNNLFINLSDPFSGNDYIYRISSGNNLVISENGVRFTSLEPSSSGIIAASPGKVRFCNSDGIIQKTVNSYGWGPCNISGTIEKDGILWIADGSAGLVFSENLSSFMKLNLPGPVSDKAFHVTSLNGKSIVTGGGTTASWNGMSRSFQASVTGENNWDILEAAGITDPVRSAIDPTDPTHFFISTWGSGLLEFRNNVLEKRYIETNSPLQSAVPGQSVVKVFGLAFDKSGNLWVTQSGLSGSIKVLRPDGTWIVNPLTINSPLAGDIAIAGNGDKWIILPGGNGIFVLDDKNTPGIFTDDRSGRFTLTDADRKLVPNVYSLACDLDGNIWVGTDQGPYIYYNPGKVFTDEIIASRITVPRNDGTEYGDYMLATEKITSIAIDGANRKWIGTASSGVYLLSSDGATRLKHYNEENSPLFSNSVSSVSVDNKTGDVWFCTSKGLISIRENSNAGSEKFSGVYAFPNPVRNDFTGNVTITGLMRDTQVKITDVSGNLVYETTSDGGMATWDMTNRRGQRVSTGVYIAFCSSPDGKESTVTKILVIR